MVKRGVGIANQIDHIRCIVGIARDPHARRHEYLVALNVKRVGQAVEEGSAKVFQLPFSIVTCVVAIDDDGELVAGEPADDRVRRQGGRQPVGNRLERRVAGEVTEGIVDVLEVIDVDVEQIQRFACAPRPRDATLQQMLELHPVWHLGECVDTREVAYPLLRPAAFSDVLRRVNTIAREHVVAFDRRSGVRHRYRFAVASQQKRLTGYAGWRIDRERATLLLVDDEIDRLADQLILAVAQHAQGRFVDAGYRTVGICDDDRFVHAR